MERLNGGANWLNHSWIWTDLVGLLEWLGSGAKTRMGQFSVRLSLLSPPIMTVVIVVVFIPIIAKRSTEEEKDESPELQENKPKKQTRQGKHMCYKTVVKRDGETEENYSV